MDLGISIFRSISLTWFVYLKLRNHKVFVTEYLIRYFNYSPQLRSGVSLRTDKHLYVQKCNLCIQYTLIIAELTC